MHLTHCGVRREQDERPAARPLQEVDNRACRGRIELCGAWVGHVQREIQEKYQVPVTAILPYAEEMLMLAGKGIFIREYPTHPLTMAIKQMTQDLIA